MRLQVKLNLLLLECLSAAGRWQEARRHAEALHRSLPLAKQRGPAAAAALKALAGWRATCMVQAAPPGQALQDMPRLLSELSMPQAKVGCRGLLPLCWASCALLPFGWLLQRPALSNQACCSPTVQLRWPYSLLCVHACRRARGWHLPRQAV